MIIVLIKTSDRSNGKGTGRKFKVKVDCEVIHDVFTVWTQKTIKGRFSWNTFCFFFSNGYSVWKICNLLITIYYFISTLLFSLSVPFWLSVPLLLYLSRMHGVGAIDYSWNGWILFIIGCTYRTRGKDLAYF